MQSNSHFLPLVIPVASKNHDLVYDKITVPPSVNCFSLGMYVPSSPTHTNNRRQDRSCAETVWLDPHPFRREGRHMHTC